LRIRPQPIGDHVHVRFYTAPAPDATFAGIGELTMSPNDWQAWRAFYRATTLGHDVAYRDEPDGTIEVTYPTGRAMVFSEAQERTIAEWAADDRLWTTQETVAFNLRAFARMLLLRE
jgi:hypothetical protein